MPPPEKKPRTAGYTLYYVCQSPACIRFIKCLRSLIHQWAGIPGRGEYVRLAFEYAGQPYTEVSDADAIVLALQSPVQAGQPPHFAPPMLELPSGRTLSQTPAILNHIAPKLGLAGELGSKLAQAETLSEEERERAEEERSAVNQLVLTALDLSNEVCLRSSTRANRHDGHHTCTPT